MSQIETRKIIIGNDPDPTKNFTIMIPDNADGSLVIGRNQVDGSVREVLRVNPDDGLGQVTPYFHAHLIGNISLVTGATTVIIPNSENSNTHNSYDPSTGRFSPKIAGFYLTNFSARFENAIAGNAIIQKNGLSIAFASHSSTGTYNSLGSKIVYLNGTTDYLNLAVVQWSGSNQTLSGGIASTWFEAILLNGAA